MSQSPPDRALRRLIARLAEVRRQDREAILSELPEDMQRDIAHLLGDYRGIEIQTPDRDERTGRHWDDQGFSPAIVSRLESSANLGMTIPSPPAGANFSRDEGHDLTAKAIATLRDCALSVQGPHGRPRPTTVGTDAGLFRRLWGQKSP